MPKTGFAFPAMASLPIADVVEVAQAAEAQGYESFWLTEGANRDSISQLAYLAAKTSRIKLGTGIITIFSRTPVMVAQTAAGMMELSGGRFILGLGTGHKASVERVQGQVFSKPASRTRDYIRIIREALKGERVSYQGEVVSVSDFRFGGPLPAGELPIYIACLGGPLARVSGEMADGVVPLMASPQGIEKLWEGIAEGAAQAGRDPSKVDVAGFIVACASDDHAQAEAEARRQIARYGSLPFYQRMMRIGGFEEEVEKIVQAQAAGESAKIPELVSDRMVESLALVGDLSRWRATIDRHRAAGVTQPIVYAAPVGPDAKASLLKAVKSLPAADLA